MGDLSLDLRRRMVQAYRQGTCKSYEEVAQVFGVGRATVSRNLRRKRETGDVEYRKRCSRLAPYRLESTTGGRLVVHKKLPSPVNEMEMPTVKLGGSSQSNSESSTHEG